MGIELLLQPREIPFPLVYSLFCKSQVAFGFPRKLQHYEDLKVHYKGFIDGSTQMFKSTILYEPTPNHIFLVSGVRSRNGLNHGMTVFRALTRDNYFAAFETEKEPCLRERYFDHKARRMLLKQNYKGVLLPKRTISRPRFPDSRYIAPFYAEA